MSGSFPSIASSHSSRSSSDRAWKVCTTPGLKKKETVIHRRKLEIITLSHLSSGIMSKQNRLSIDSDILTKKSHLFLKKM